MINKKYRSGVQEYAHRCYCLYECYNKYKNSRKSRTRKSNLRKAFNYWYKCPDFEGNYNEMYWQYITEFNSDYTFREEFGSHLNILTVSQVAKFLQEIEKRVKKINE